jgi:hypothetical protein
MMLIVVLISLYSYDAEATDTPPANGDWTVDPMETVMHSSTSFDLRGDLNVLGTLELDNCTLWVWLESTMPRVLTVWPGGELRLVNSDVASQGLGRPYVFRADEGSTLVLDRAAFFRAGDRLTVDGSYAGVRVSTDAIVKDSEFIDCLVGLWVDGAEVNVSGCTFYGCQYGAVVDGEGTLDLTWSEIIQCTRGVLSNASRLSIDYLSVSECEEGILAYGGNLTVKRASIDNCSVLAIGGYSTEATIWECFIRDSDADGIVFHESRAWLSNTQFLNLTTDVKVVHSEAWIWDTFHKVTYNEALWMYHSTFHVWDVTTQDSYWALRAWKSKGECTNLTAINATYGAHLERCDDVLLEEFRFLQENKTRQHLTRGMYVTGGSYRLFNSTISGARTGIDMLSAAGTIRDVDITDCSENGVMISLSWFFTMTNVTVTYSKEGFWLNLFSGGRLERCRASLCDEQGFRFTAGATTTLVECNVSANPLGIMILYASPVLRDIEMFMCDDSWCITNETLGMDALAGAPVMLGGTVIGGYGGLRLNETRAVIEGVTFINPDRWAIQVRESTGDTISDCSFLRMPNATAIFVWHGTPVIKGNSFFRVNYAITGADGSHLTIEDNTIVNVTYDAIWIVANSSAVMSGNLIMDVGYYGIHAMLYADVVSQGDIIRDMGSYCVFVWKASTFYMRGGAFINSSVGVYAFDAISVDIAFSEVRDLNRGIVSYKDKSANALTSIQHVTVEGCYLTNQSAYAIGVFDVDLTVIDCTFLDNIAAIQANNATVTIMDSTMVGSWLFGLKAEGTSQITWQVEDRCRILSSDIYGNVDIVVGGGGDLVMEDVLWEPTPQGSLTSLSGARVAVRGCEMRANGAIIRFTDSDVDLVNSSFTAVGPPLGGGPGTLGVTVNGGNLDINRCTFRRVRAGLSLVGTKANITDTKLSECGNYGIYCKDSSLDLVRTRINRTMVGDAIHLVNSNMRAFESSVTIGLNGIVMHDSQAIMDNCSLGGTSTYSLVVTKSTLVLMNTTYQTDRTNVMDWGRVEVWWHLTALVEWPNLEELGLATVMVDDVTDAEVARGRPDVNGYVRMMKVMAMVLQKGGDTVHGPHTVTADLLGYTVAVTVNLTASRTVHLNLEDLDPPVFDVQGPIETEIWTRSDTITIFGLALDAGSGTDEVRVTTGFGTVLKSQGDVFSFNIPLTDGRHVLELKASDKAGNVATYQLVVWVEVDALIMSPPEPSDGTLTSSRSVVIKGRLSRVEDVTVRVNRVLATIDTANRSYSLPVDLLEGDNYYSILAEDIYGHQAWANITLTADWTPPELVITTPMDVNITDEWVVISGSVDPESKLYIQGSLVLLREWGTFSVKYPVYVGESAIKVRAEDEIGNAEEVVVYVFRQEVSIEPPSQDPWEIYIFLIIIPIMVVVVYIVLRRFEAGGE